MSSLKILLPSFYLQNKYLQVPASISDSIIQNTAAGNFPEKTMGPTKAAMVLICMLPLKFLT